MNDNIHLQCPSHASGPVPEAAATVAILIHGRTQSPADMFAITERLSLSNVSYVALEAYGNSWYPDKFMAPVENNQPYLDHALETIAAAVASLEAKGLDRRHIVLIGFSQGACLACEYLYRNPARWGGLIAYTGGLIGPESLSWRTHCSLEGTPVLLANSDLDTWVPLERTEQTAEVFQRMGAEVQLKVYPGMEHLVNDDEIALGREILQTLIER
ncbi:alpha/beta hydrolase [Pseudomonas sp. FME51]|uniref:alpha/beta hydrolase n=1 Tax=Pseudomonas sp. FME51 TaxID=2742609 RepID=UPI001867989E|nr:dienelactone hydrolase family protein [Pseudomonas sp. FME51]